MAIDLFNEALGIDGGEPVTINVGDDIELQIRTSHTGLQAAAWMRAESKRVDTVEQILGAKDMTDSQRLQALQKTSKTYAVELIKSVAIDVDSKTANAAATAICALPAEARTAVFRKLGDIAGVVDKNGNTFLSEDYLKTKSNED